MARIEGGLRSLDSGDGRNLVVIKNAWSGYPALVAGAWSRTSVTSRV